MSHGSMADCPDPSALAQYASGSLDETGADALAKHLPGCDSCRSLVDELARDSDSLLEALRHPVGGVDSQVQQVITRFISEPLQSETERITNSKTGVAPASDESISLEVFLSCLRKSRLLRREHIDQVVEQSTAVDTETLARELVERRMLTRYQAAALKRGRYRRLVLGNYVLLRRLGGGGMGKIYKARHRRMKRVVCLKVLRPSGRKSREVVERFRREATTAGALDHPNIVVAHDADEDRGVPFLVMEYIKGRDLSRHVARHGPMDVPQAIASVQQVAEALDYAHRLGVIHRDIKPSNLIFTAPQRTASPDSDRDDAPPSELQSQTSVVKILDMGLARFDNYLGSSPDASTYAAMTNSGIVMGTIDYMSPEQAINSHRADARSDMYSLGCTLYFLLTGELVFAGETLMEKLIAHREHAPPQLKVLDWPRNAELNAVFQSMIAKSPADRYQTMGELVEDLTALQEGRHPRVYVPRHRLKRTVGRLTKSAAVLLAIGLGLGLAYIFAKPTWMFQQSGTALRFASVVAASVQGHPDTLANGGPGRVLLVLPHDWFYEDHYQEIVLALRRSRVQVQTSSSLPGTARPKHGAIKPVQLHMDLDQFHPDDFDAVVFLGGNVGEFTHKGRAHQQARRLLHEGLDAGRTIVAIGDARSILADSGLLRETRFETKSGCRIGRPPDYSGKVVLADRSNSAPDIVSLVLAEHAAKNK